MQIEIRSRNGIAITDDLRSYAARRFEKIEKMISGHARLELELMDECNPAIADHFSVNATLHTKGKTLHVSNHSYDLKHAMREVSEALVRQVDKRARKRRVAERRAAKALDAQPPGLIA
jgi:ribosomal subunit interface protein